MGSVWHRVYVHSSICETFSVVVLHRSMVKWRNGRGQSAMGKCSFCYMGNLRDIVLFRHLCLIRGYICLQYMCILLYVKLIWYGSVA